MLVCQWEKQLGGIKPNRIYQLNTVKILKSSENKTITERSNHNLGTTKESNRHTIVKIEGGNLENTQ